MKPNKATSFLLAFILILAVFLFNMSFAPGIPVGLLRLIRIILVAVFGIAMMLFHLGGQRNAGRLSLTLMAINLAFFVVSFLTSAFLGVSNQTAEGIAYSKLSDSLVISLVLVAVLLSGGFKLKDMYLVKGKLVIGLVIGIISFIFMGYLAIHNPDQPMSAEFLKENALWILIFVLCNGFMEELMFRGIFLPQLGNFMKPVWAIILTSVVFGLAHMQVNYTPDVLFFVGITLVLGLIWGFLVHYTKSIFASVLFHAGADLLIIIPVYVSFGVQ